MTRKLLFSHGSPFARRVRIILLEKGLTFEPDVNDALRPVDAIEPHNPLLQVPVMYDAGYRLFGTALITEYIYATYPQTPARTPPLAGTITREARHWEDRLILTAIESLSDTLVNLRLLLADGALDAPYRKRQWLRIRSTLDWLEGQMTPEGFWPGVFSVMDIALLCPLQFAEKRGMFEVASGRWPGIAAMMDHWAGRPSVQSTPVNTIAPPSQQPVAEPA